MLRQWIDVIILMGTPFGVVAFSVSHPFSKTLMHVGGTYMMVWNSGKGKSNILQNQFTRYLKTAIRRKKIDISREKKKIYGHECYNNTWHEFSCPVTEDTYFEFLIEFESINLEQILLQIEKRDRYIFYSHAMDERSFSELANELGIGYKGVAAAYYRVLQKIRKKIRGDGDGV